MKTKLPVFLFGFGIFICLLQVWLPEYYLTGDGPCHSYNAIILKSFFTGEHKDFYTQFFYLSPEVNPNWFTHIILSALMLAFNSIVSEKILLSIYVVIFALGYKQLVAGISDDRDNYMILFGFLFIFHMPLAKGFYNFSISVAVALWVIIFWLRFLRTGLFRDYIVFLLLTAIVFFAHPIGFVISVVTCFSLALFNPYSEYQAVKSAVRKIFLLGITYLCFFLFLALFINGHSGFKPELTFESKRIESLLTFRYLVTENDKEILPAAIAGLFMLSCLLYMLLRRKPVGKSIVSKWRGLTIPLLFSLGVYLFFPDNLFGGGMMVMRMQWILYIFIALKLTCMMYAVKWKAVSGILLFTIFIFLSTVRIYYGILAADGVADYVSAEKYIKPYSVVLPLSFAHSGKTIEGEPIINQNWVYGHAAEYIAAYKPVILLENYEAHTGYFPLLWRDKVNPFKYLSKDEGIESETPGAALNEYEQYSGVKIDYVLTWCYNAAKNPSPELMRQIKANYSLKYTSPTGRTVLYARNK